MSLCNFLSIDSANNQKSMGERWNTFVMRFQNYLVAFAITEEETKLGHFFEMAGNDVHELYNTLRFNSRDEDDVQETPLGQAIRVLTTHFNRRDQQQMQKKPENEHEQINVRAVFSNINQEVRETGSTDRTSNNQEVCETSSEAESNNNQEIRVTSSEASSSINEETCGRSSEQELAEHINNRHQDLQRRTSEQHRKQRRFINPSSVSSINRDKQRERQNTGRAYQNHYGFLPADFIQHVNEYHVILEQPQVSQPTVSEGNLNIISTNSLSVQRAASVKASTKCFSINATRNSGNQRNPAKEPCNSSLATVIEFRVTDTTPNVKPKPSKQRHQVNKAIYVIKPSSAFPPNVKLKPSKQRHQVNKPIYVIKQNTINCLPKQLQLSSVFKVLNPAIKSPNTKRRVDNTNSKQRKREGTGGKALHGAVVGATTGQGVDEPHRGAIYAPHLSSVTCTRRPDYAQPVT